MKLSRFRAIIEAYGAHPDHWPARERQAAALLANSSLREAPALAQARSLDGALRSTTLAEFVCEPEQLRALKSRILADARPQNVGWFERWLGFDLTPSQLWPSIAGLALAAVLGVGVGAGGLLQVEPGHESEDASTLSTIDFPAESQ